jgi:16S rRNA (guanine966-N2)-methyltransferase
MVREALFSVLGPEKPLGARALDLFAGSGALGLEALSRGASLVVFSDSSPKAVSAVKQNIARLPEVFRNKTRVLRLKFPQGYPSLAAHGPFDLFLIDPPYRDDLSKVLGFLSLAAETGLAGPGAAAVWEQSPESLKKWDFAAQSPWRVTLARRWGDRAAAILELGPGSPDPPDRLAPLKPAGPAGPADAY